MIGICGGIGAGKSVVSRLLRTRGYCVYDCDYEAKRLMDNSEVMISQMCLRWGDSIYDSEKGLDRKEIARLVFSDPQELAWLNTLVHKEVYREIETLQPTFIESAILYSSGLYALCEEVWEVNASERERVKRVIERNGMSEEEVESRIRAQRDESEMLRMGCLRHGISLKKINNDNQQSLLQAVEVC